MSVITRRTLLGALATSPLWFQSAWAQSTSLKISHQFPGGSVAEGDFRDRLCRMFAAEVEKRTRGSLKFSIYPGSSLMKTNAQFSAMRKSALDLSLVPLSYAGGELPEVNIGLMPGLVTSYDQGYAWKNAEVGKELSRILAEKGVIIVSWIWQAGGVASRSKAIIDPEDARGLKVRGGSREMDLMLKEAGAAVVTLPSNEIYAGMQTGAMDAALTSSTSLISFRLEEVSKALTTGRAGAYWFMFEPLMMSKAVFDRLPKDQQAAIMAVGADLESFGRKTAQADDAAVAAVYQRAGARVVDLNPAALKKWQDIARNTAWKDYGARNANCAKLLALAEKTL
jgi:TRAP-type C4-dicarboxylate transport system substrate-binding protein